MDPPRSPREVFLALVNGIADGNPDGLPELYAEQIDVVHPFDPLHGAPLRSRDETPRAHGVARRPAPAAPSGRQRHDPRDDRSRGHRRRVRIPGNQPTPESRTRCPPSS